MHFSTTIDICNLMQMLNFACCYGLGQSLYLYLKSTKLHLYFKRNKTKRGDRRMSGAVGESVGSAVDAPPHHPPTRTVIELRELLLTDDSSLGNS